MKHVDGSNMKLQPEHNIRQFGSNPGGVHYDESGNKYYLKTPRDPLQAHTEVATSKLYNAVGIKTLNPFIHDDKHVVSAWQSAKPFGSHQSIVNHIGDNAEHHIDLAKIHHMAVITKNHDIVGLDHDNLLHGSNGIISADQGGALKFRAMGEPKEFGNDVEEIESFNHPHRNSRIFQEVHPLAHVFAANEIKKHLTDDTIDKIISEHGLGQDVADTIKGRRDKLISHYGKKNLEDLG